MFWGFKGLGCRFCRVRASGVRVCRVWVSVFMGLGFIEFGVQCLEGFRSLGFWLRSFDFRYDNNNEIKTPVTVTSTRILNENPLFPQSLGLRLIYLRFYWLCWRVGR